LHPGGGFELVIFFRDRSDATLPAKIIELSVNDGKCPFQSQRIASLEGQLEAAAQQTEALAGEKNQLVEQIKK
jgi:hypothetical protein